MKGARRDKDAQHDKEARQDKDAEHDKNAQHDRDARRVVAMPRDVVGGTTGACNVRQDSMTPRLKTRRSGEACFPRETFL